MIKGEFMEGVRTTIKDSVDDFIQICRRTSPHICRVNGPCNGWPKLELLNPSIPCNLSREFDEPEQHAPVGMSSPHGLSKKMLTSLQRFDKL
jgi:hypothetical protein